MPTMGYIQLQSAPHELRIGHSRISGILRSTTNSQPEGNNSYSQNRLINLFFLKTQILNRWIHILMTQCLLRLCQIPAKLVIDAVGERLPHGMGAAFAGYTVTDVNTFENMPGLSAVNRPSRILLGSKDLSLTRNMPLFQFFNPFCQCRAGFGM